MVVVTLYRQEDVTATLKDPHAPALTGLPWQHLHHSRHRSALETSGTSRPHVLSSWTLFSLSQGTPNTKQDCHSIRLKVWSRDFGGKLLLVALPTLLKKQEMMAKVPSMTTARLMFNVAASDTQYVEEQSSISIVWSPLPFRGLWERPGHFCEGYSEWQCSSSIQMLWCCLFFRLSACHASGGLLSS
eukprot:2453602-Amphidinium_carterae.1